ncbi:MAG: excinuclease ABC subunit UvrC [Actinobacteria bacterium]|nr:excinuclease ABC subunit UvrC [Actinomycetota bacterium]
MDSMEYRPPTASIPDSPGSYQFVDREGRVLYVGKAKSLRRRLTSYGSVPATSYRTTQMLALADHVEWVVVETELEALILEHSLIQTHKPRFNVRLKDDKSYPWLAVTTNDVWPRPVVVRGERKKAVRYFGPFPQVRALREVLDLLSRTFPLRTCSDAKFRRHERLGRPCLLFDIERCSGPCVGAIDQSAYQSLVEGFMKFMSGETAPIVDSLRTEMEEAAAALEFERAARLRDRLVAIGKAAETQQVVTERSEEFDVVGFAQDALGGAVQVFHVRNGRLVGRAGLLSEKVEDLNDSSIMERIVAEVYGDAPAEEIPRKILLNSRPVDDELIESWLVERRNGPVSLVVPSRGSKRALLEMANENAKEDLARHRLRRAADHNARSRALVELQDALGLAEAPLRIECYDMSHLQGTDYVGSMVVFEDALAKKSDYRRFEVKTVTGNDDYAAMEEVLTRRLSALVDDRGVAAGDETADNAKSKRRRPARFAYTPQLILIDGGKGQLGVAVRVVESLSLTGKVELAALAKRFEEVYRPGREEPIRIPRGSDALYLLQRVRDEAHRFAITYHRSRRGSRMTKGALDGVSGLGAKRRSRLLEEVGGMKMLRQASLADLTQLTWLPESVARDLDAKLHPESGQERAEREIGKNGEMGQVANEVASEVAGEAGQ